VKTAAAPLGEELRDLARRVRRLDNGYRADPESIAIEKDYIAGRLFGLADGLGT
jgi:hypothetical protein